MEFDCFEDYYRVKWQYGKRYVNGLISAAKVVNCLGTNRSHPKPQHETRVRPLIGLTEEQVKGPWELAVKKAAGKRISERLVRAAVRELGFVVKPQPKSQTPPRRTLAAKRQAIDDAIGQLLALLSQKASHELLREKVEALHGQIRALLS